MVSSVTPGPVRGMRAWMAGAGLPAASADLVDELAELEALKCAIEGRQARLAVALAADQRARAGAAGEPAERRSRGVAAQVALARRVSPHRGQRLLALATTLATEMPFTQAALRAGAVSEWRATIIARETACLSREDRALVDAELAADHDRLAAMGDREVAQVARRRAVELDNAAMARRRARAESERRVSVRPAPDAMVQLTALLPVAEGVAVYAALRRAADAAVATGAADGRGRAMADELVRRVTRPGGRADGVRATPSLAVQLSMSTETLLGASDEAARIDEVGPLPAALARALVAEALEDADARVWLRRLFVRPADGRLVAMESRQRLVPSGLARFIRSRDQVCRTPWCDAPVRHVDHVVPAAEGGPTSATNLQGLCEACNHARQAPGWHARPPRDVSGEVVTTTPTGRTYRSLPPPAAPRRGRDPGRPRVDLAYAA